VVYFLSLLDGICFEFDPKCDSNVFGVDSVPIEVDYPESPIRPIMKSLVVNTTTHHYAHWRILWTKSVDWKHEKEVRSIRFNLKGSDRAIKYEKKRP
jgi:hypothetical protein